MARMIPLEKQNKRKRKEFYKKQRGSWHGVCPVTRTIPNRKAYDRKRTKHQNRGDRDAQE